MPRAVAEGVAVWWRTMCFQGTRTRMALRVFSVLPANSGGGGALGAPAFLGADFLGAACAGAGERAHTRIAAIKSAFITARARECIKVQERGSKMIANESVLAFRISPEWNAAHEVDGIAAVVVRV